MFESTKNTLEHTYTHTQRERERERERKRDNMYHKTKHLNITANYKLLPNLPY